MIRDEKSMSLTQGFQTPRIREIAEKCSGFGSPAPSFRVSLELYKNGGNMYTETVNVGNSATNILVNKQRISLQ
jgi:hypothetical protein